MNGKKLRLLIKLDACYLVVAFGCLLIGVVFFYTWYRIDFEYKGELYNMKREGTNMSNAFQNHIYRVVKDADNLLLAVRENEVMEHQYQPLMKLVMRYFYRESVFWQTGIVNENEDVIVLQGQGDSSQVKMSDNFLYHRQEQRDILYIQRPSIANSRFLTVSRRMEREDGSFGGMVYVVVDATRITDFFVHMELGADKLITMVGSDGIIRARQNTAGFTNGQSIKDSPLISNAAVQPAGTFSSYSLVDHVQRTQYYRTIPEYNMIASIGISEKDSLTAFEKRKQVYWETAWIFNGVIIGFCSLLVWRIRKQNELQAQIAVSARRTASLQMITGHLVGNFAGEEELFMTIIWDALHLVGAPDGHIGLLDESGKYITAQYVIGIYEGIRDRPMPADQGARREVLGTGRPVYIEDYRKYSQRINDPVLDKITTMMVYPLKRGGNTIGVFHVSWQGRVYKLSADEKGLLDQYANLTAMALENMYVHRQLKIELQEREWRQAELMEARARLEEANQKLQEVNGALVELAATDKLTGAWNRRKFEEVVCMEIENARRYQFPLSFLLLDIDHFKMINDVYGHQMGDFVLIELVKLLTKNMRATDMVFRWGGEEFIVMLMHTPLERGVALAEKIRQNVESHSFLPDRTVTVSGGGTEFCGEDTVYTIMGRVDDALYAAKNSGRNQVKVRAGN